MSRCEMADCQQDAQVLIDAEVIELTDDGVGEPDIETLAVCRIHALRHQLASEELER